MRENTWLKNAKQDTRPEWPEAAAATGNLPAAGDRAQAFPDTRGTEILASDDESILVSDEESAESADSAGRLKPSPEGAALRDPWENGNDPDEVTVQLDAVALRPGNRLVGRPGGSDTSDAAGPDGSDSPVFVDESGRRSRRYRRIGILAGTTCAVYAVVIVVTLLSGNSSAPWLPVPARDEGKEAGQVETSPLPANPAEPTYSGGALPGVPLLPGGGTPLSPGVGATTPGASASPAGPGLSVAPKPTATRTTPGTGSGPSPDPGLSTDPSASATPTPTPTQEPSTGPSESPGSPTGSAGTGTGTETVADGTSSPLPVESSSPESPESPESSNSPEYTL